MKLLLILLSLCIATCVIDAAPAEDEIIDLPGLSSQPPFKQYSGYLDTTGGRHLFYWLVEAETVDPATAPIVFWFNGGPGCSSLDGFLTENGPYRIDEGGETLSYNPYSWNQVANVIFLESPAGVGFSYSDDGSYISSDDQTASDNYLALESFYAKFPEYAANPLFLTGESYAGVYIPTLTVLILNGTNNFNLQGIAVGNGIHDDIMNFNSEVIFDAFHALFDYTITTRLMTYCCFPTTPVTCEFFNPFNTDCDNAVTEALLAAGLSGVNPYGIYDYCDSAAGARRHRARINRPLPQTKSMERLKQLQDLRSAAPCSDETDEDTYLNSAAVRAALHVSSSALQWTMCSDILVYFENYISQTAQYQYILPQLRALLYHGDTDTVCNYLGGEWFAESLELQVLGAYRKWTYGNQTAGFVKDYANLSYLTVLGSGHMVPTDRPAQALKMFTNFINNLPYDN